MHRRNAILAVAICVWPAAPAAVAQVPTPVIQSGLVAGSNQIQGSFSKPAAGSPAVSLKLFINGAGPTPEPRILIEMNRAEFTIELTDPLKGGEFVSVQQTAPQTSEKSPEKRVPAIPKVDGDLLDGAKEVTVIAVPGSPPVSVLVTDGAATSTLQSREAEVPKDCSSAKPDACKIVVKLEAALAEGQRVLAKEKHGVLSAAVKVKAKPDAAPYTPSIVSVEAYYGADKIKIFFQKLSDKVEKASAVVTTCLEQKSYSFTDDDLKATSVEVPLVRGLFCKQEAGADKKVELKVSMKAGAASKPAEQSFPALTPDLLVSGRLLEGDGKVSGKAGPTVSKVRVVVYSGWTGDEATLEAVRAAIDAAEADKGRPNTKEDPDKIKRLDVRLKELNQRRDILNNPERYSKVVFSPVGATGAIDSGRPGVRCLLGEIVQEIVDVPVSSGAFTATLSSRLNAGDCVVAIAEFPLRGSGPATSTGIPVRITVSSRPVIAQSSILDWGRLRAYFTVGGGISHYNDQFSRTDTFIGFTGDARLFGEVLDKKGPDGGPIEFKKYRWQINAFVDARVSVKLAETGQGQSVENTTTAARTLAANTPILTPQLKFGGTQPGYAMLGLHSPLSFRGMEWQHKGQSLSFFFGPIVRFGGQTQNSETVVYRNLYTHPFTLEGKQLTAFTVNREETRGGVLPIYQAGARIGIYQYDLLGDAKRQRQVANDLVAYLDVVWGRSFAYRSYGYKYTLGAVTEKQEDGTVKIIKPQEIHKANSFQFLQDPRLKEVEITSQVRPRFYVEGRLKIPTVPALIGVDFGVRKLSQDFEPNEFRFVLAFRIDAQKALGRLFRNSDLQTGF